MLATIKLLVQTNEGESQSGSGQNSDERSSAVHRHSRNYKTISLARREKSMSMIVLTEPRAIARGIHITSIDTASITDAINSSEGCSTLRRRTRQGVRDPTQGHNVTRVERRWHEHHGEVARGGTSCSGSDDESCNGDVQRDSDVEVTLAGAIGMPGIGECANDGKTVWRRGKEESLDVAVLEGFDDGGEEIGDRGGGNDAQDHEHLKKQEVSAGEVCGCGMDPLPECMS